MPDTSPKPPDPRDERTYVLDDQLGYLLRLANQRHTGIFQKHVVLNLTPTQFAALMRLDELGECSQNRLGRNTAMDVATIKGVVDRLRGKGLVELKPDPTDKRRLLVYPSEKYWESAERLREIGSEITRETMDPLTPAERDTLLRLLKKLI